MRWLADEVAAGFRPDRVPVCMRAGRHQPGFHVPVEGAYGRLSGARRGLDTDEIYGTFYGDFARRIPFLHSHSDTGNRLACRAALATALAVSPARR
jgi:adenosylmethionine-8-amino-7-oxononanoate aminotransferase